MIEQEVTFYMDFNGVMLVVEKHHKDLFAVLTKLGIKSVPTREMASIMTTMMPSGTYTVSYNINGKQVTCTATVVPEPTLPELQVKIPKYEKRNRGVSRSQRNQWKDLSSKHSRSTGRL